MTDPDQPRRLALQQRQRARNNSPIPDWASCINCKVPARHGVIVHGRTCPEYGRTSGVDRAPTTADRPAHIPVVNEPPRVARDRYERFIAMLKEGRRDRYECPACGAAGDGHGLKVDFDGQRIKFHCFSCGGGEVLRALGLSISWLTGEKR